MAATAPATRAMGEDRRPAPLPGTLVVAVVGAWVVVVEEDWDVVVVVAESVVDDPEEVDVPVEVTVVKEDLAEVVVVVAAVEDAVLVEATEVVAEAVVDTGALEPEVEPVPW